MKLKLVILLHLFLICTPVKAIQIPALSDLESTSMLARSHQLPVLLFFSSEDCPFCEKLKAHIIRPMIISGDYQDKVIIRELHVADGQFIRQGENSVDSVLFSRNYNVWIYPTLILVDHQWCQLGEAIVGINTLELFSGRVDDAIKQANQLIKTRQYDCPNSSADRLLGISQICFTTCRVGTALQCVHGG